jgi:branched-chain amino acid transport system substrate-binding protein
MRIANILSAIVLLSSAQAFAQDAVKIGFLTDMSSVYADIEGKSGAVAVGIPLDDFGGKVNGMPIEFFSADHQNKADIAASKAREWIDTQGATAIFVGTNSAVGLAVAKVASDKKRVYMNVSGATAALTNEACTPYTVHYAHDTVAFAKGTGSAVVERGGKTWFFLAADYSFGQALQGDTTKVVTDSGGTVVGGVRHPLNTSDFSSFLLQAQSSNAQILGLANAGGDMINAVKAAKEFGVDKTMQIVGLLVTLSDVHSMGLNSAGGLLFTTSWYWDLNDETRTWSNRFFEKTQYMPTEVQAADYSAATTYLKAVEAAKTTDADAVMAELKKMRIDDFYAKGYIRADGRAIHDMYLMQVKDPAESKGMWDYYKVLTKLDGEKVFTTKAESKCPLWK